VARAKIVNVTTVWPFFDLEITSPRLTLRYPNDDDLALVADAATTGIHDVDSMPFYMPWSRAEPPQLQRNIVQFAWSCRATLTPTNWHLPFVVFENDLAIGIQDLFAQEFPTTRAVETGSWLIQSAQGRGIGKEMRAAVLHLAFECLNAEEAYSASFEDNPASGAVSISNGYEPNGIVLLAREGRVARNLKWVLTRARWAETRRTDIQVSGVTDCLPLLGASPHE
jgi:RimJ/RimL family protein N-acetyltransferase